MIGVLLHLQARTLRGRVVRSLRLLRQPKYLIGSIAGALWMLLWVGRPLLRTGTHFRMIGIDMVPDELRTTVHMAAATLLSFAIVLPWLWPWGGPGIRLRKAELTFLLQAPLTRRQVIGYGLLKSALGTLLTALLLGGDLRGRLLLFSALLPLLAFWSLHSKWRAMLRLRQRGLLTGIGATFLVALAVLTLRFAPQLFASDFTQPWPPLLRTLLLPGRLLSTALFAQGAGEALLASLPVALLAVLQLELVLRSRTPFEESALEWARATEARQSAGRQGTRRRGGLTRRWQVFRLHSAGRPEVAVLWKNLMRVSRLPLLRGVGAAVALLVGFVVLSALVPVLVGIHITIVIMGLVTAGAAPLFAGMSFHNDLRTELAHLELVRTWPVPASRFVWAQVASPALLSTLVGLAGLGLALAGYLGAELDGVSSMIAVVPADGTLGVSATGFVLLGLSGIVPLLAGASFATSALQNLATLFVPAWMIQTPDSNRGIAAFGRNLIVGTAMFFGFLLAFLPSALLVGAAMLAQHFAGIAWSAWAFPLWGLLAAAPLFALTAVLVLFAGRLWAELDPSEELLEIGR